MTPGFSSMSRVETTTAALLAGAACLNANPRLFDITDPIRATFALRYCRLCPVKGLCLAVVNPEKSYYDGICGGIVWRNGREVARLTQARRSA